MKKSLKGTWQLKYNDRRTGANGVLEATVPGNVELEFIKKGDLPQDIFFGENMRLLEKYETYDYTYTTIFNVENPTKKHRITFLGVDCYADYFFNGEKIGSSNNALVEHAFEVSGLKQKGNELTVVIKSAFYEKNEKDYTLRSSLCHWGNQYPEGVYVRKPAHCFSWDIMPRCVSAGIFRDVIIEEVNPAEFSQLYVGTVKFDDTVASCYMFYDVHKDTPYYPGDEWSIEISGSCEDSEFYCKQNVYYGAGSVEFAIPNPKLWWPKNYGKPNMYKATVKLTINGKVVTTKEVKFGIRTVKIFYSDYATANEGEFYFEVNGKKIFVMGTNWTPLSPFHSQDKDLMANALKDLDDCGSNMVRMWGGNVYETDEFFDFTDEKGILVWHDFAFGCAMYPHDKDFLDTVKIEATKVVKRLRQHPSIAIWAGDNEDDLVHVDYGYNPQLNKISRGVLADVVFDHDRFRDYLPSSPFVSEKAYKMDAWSYTPESHLWGQRPFFKSDMYSKSNASFISEIGCPGAVDVEIAKKFISSENLNKPDSAEWITHCVDWYLRDYRWGFVDRQVKNLFGASFEDYAEFAILSQIAQAEAFKFHIEHMRLGKPKKSGIIWWNLHDGWPQVTEAVIDFYGNKKTAYDVIKRSQKPFTFSVKTDSENRLILVALNDGAKNVTVNYTVVDGDTGETIKTGKAVTVAGENKELGFINVNAFSQKLLIIKFDGEANGFNHYITGYPTYDKEKVKAWYEIIKNWG